jgi:hypothetical protein
MGKSEEDPAGRTRVLRRHGPGGREGEETSKSPPLQTPQGWGTRAAGRNGDRPGGYGTATCLTKNLDVDKELKGY